MPPLNQVTGWYGVEMTIEAIVEPLRGWDNAAIMMKIILPLWKNESQTSAAAAQGSLIGEGWRLDDTDGDCRNQPGPGDENPGNPKSTVPRKKLFGRESPIDEIQMSLWNSNERGKSQVTQIYFSDEKPSNCSATPT